MATFYLGPTDAFIAATLNTLRSINHVSVPAYLGLILSGPSASDGTGVGEMTTNTDFPQRVACSFGAASARQMANTAILTLQASTLIAWNGGLPIKRFGIWSAQAFGSGVLQWVEEISPALVVSATVGQNIAVGVGSLILRSVARTGTE